MEILTVIMTVELKRSRRSLLVLGEIGMTCRSLLLIKCSNLQQGRKSVMM